MASPSTTTPLEPVQEDREADAEGTTSIIETIRRPFIGGRRAGNATLKEEVRRRNSMERKQKTPPRTWLHRVAAKLTISRGTKCAIKSSAGDEGVRKEGTDKPTRRSGFKRKPIPSFAPPENDEGCQDKNDDTPSLSRYSSSSHEAGTHASTHRSSTSIRTPRSTEDHNTDATSDQIWDFGEDGDSCSGQAKTGSNMVRFPPSILVGNTVYIPENLFTLPRFISALNRPLYTTPSRSMLSVHFTSVLILRGPC
jgi:hypothetical protein